MDRVSQTPRDDWATRLKTQGFEFHSIGPDGVPRTDGRFHYWREDIAYRFSEGEVETLYAATRELHALALDIVDDVVARGAYERFALPLDVLPWIERSWMRRDFSLYGRFDIAWDGAGPPKLLEYNADTPTALVETAVAQWFWKEDVQPAADQFNSVHEALVARWRAFRTMRPRITRVHAAAMPDSAEDIGNVRYVIETAREAGLESTFIAVPDIGADERGDFFDLDDRPIEAIFKLYPWEWAIREPFGRQLRADRTTWIEPPWKMLMANKALLPLLWARHPDHPNLLPAYFDAERLAGRPHVRKPLLSREGSNVSLVRPGQPVLETDGPYGHEGYVWQSVAALPAFDGVHAVIGSWIVGDDAVGIGIREDASPITRDTSYFVPHYFA
jgi:glutathionylspermidine synthase